MKSTRALWWTILEFLSVVQGVAITGFCLSIPVVRLKIRYYYFISQQLTVTTTKAFWWFLSWLNWDVNLFFVTSCTESNFRSLCIILFEKYQGDLVINRAFASILTALSSLCSCNIRVLLEPSWQFDLKYGIIILLFLTLF